ncbi:MAG: hypothetical protein ACQES4_10100 [Bacillota bacterium]
MKRTQILVKEEQHNYLVQQAEVNNTSISDIIRKMIDEKMAETINKQSQGGIRMAKFAVDGPVEYKHHDEDLY